MEECASRFANSATRSFKTEMPPEVKSESQKRRWTREEVRTLIEMTEQGVNRREISLKLGRSYKAVKNRILHEVPHLSQEEDCNLEEKLRPYEKALEILKERHEYNNKLGNIVDNMMVTVQEMMRIAGVIHE